MKEFMLFRDNYQKKDTYNENDKVYTVVGPYRYGDLFDTETLPTDFQFITKNNILVVGGIVMKEGHDCIIVNRFNRLFKIPKPSNVGGIELMAETLVIVFKHFFTVSLNSIDKELLYQFLSKLKYNKPMLKDDNKVDMMFKNLLDNDFHLSHYIDFEYYETYMYIDDIKVSYALIKDIIRRGRLKILFRWYLYYYKNINMN